MSKMLYQGHGSYRFTTNDGRVVYVDPYAGEGKEAAECATLIGAKHNVIVHLSPGRLFDRAKAERWNAPNKLIVGPGEEIELSRAD